MDTRSPIQGLVVLFAVAVLGGCAGTGGNFLGGIDADGLNNAIALDDSGVIRGAVSRGLDVNQRIPAPGYSTGAPLIALAARSASIGTLRYLISAGADVNARTPALETPLMLAAYFRDDGVTSTERHDEAVRILVEAKAHLENEPHNYTPLAYAAYNNRQNALRLLLSRGARVDGDAEERLVYINTPLMMAAIQGHRDVVRLLLQAGADPQVRIKDGGTARELARKYRHSHVEPLLVCAESMPPGARYSQHCESPSFAGSR